MQNYTIKDQKKLLIKPRLHSQSREGTQQQQQPRIAIQNTTVYRNTTADKHRKHSVDNQKQVKQKKKKKVQKNIQQLDNEEEQRLLLEEQKRLRDLEEFQKQQWEKMSAEERERLKKEENDRQTIEMLWDREIHERKKQQQEIDEWNDFLRCNLKPNPRVEKDLNTFIYQVSNNEQCIDYTSQLIESLKVAHNEDLSQSLFQKQEHYFRYIEKLKSIQNEKIQQLIKFHVMNYENYLDELNQILKTQYFMLEFTPETQQRILQKLAQKPEERSKYEILKQTEYNKQFRLGFWYCPLSKIGYRIKPVEFNQIFNLAIEIPRQLAGQCLVYRIVWTHYDPFTNYKTYNQYLPIGGVFQTACLQLPKLSKKKHGWTLKPTFDESFLQPIKLNSGFQPYSCFYQISKEYFLQDASKLFIVTHQNNKWTQDGIEDLKINLETRSVSFNLKNQIPFMMATHRFVDFPFKQWKISSLFQEKVHLRIETQRDIDIQIELNQKLATLISPLGLAKQFPEPIGIVELLVKLRDIGINLIAQEEDAVCLQTVFKMSELENQALLNMMQTLRIYSFRNSKWNRKCGADQVIIQFIENPLMNKDFEGDDEFQWRHLEFQMNKVAMIECSEKSDKLSTKWAKNTVSHANLLMLVQQHQITPPELQYYIEEVQNVEFRAHFRTMLKVMRLLSIN